ncbi:hypothetical protein EVAR_85258_1 [Eumeta japonica]|uniref:Uncharacterized protein n=1 Tax=Eumeta variegata TaxID=151549 RepID=A0A4C1V6R5_EUMVA|nr:hypothetical protein EVAR_85258_1 [Eumeta japonica]
MTVTGYKVGSKGCARDKKGRVTEYFMHNFGAIYRMEHAHKHKLPHKTRRTPKVAVAAGSDCPGCSYAVRSPVCTCASGDSARCGVRRV